LSRALTDCGRYASAAGTITRARETLNSDVQTTYVIQREAGHPEPSSVRGLIVVVPVDAASNFMGSCR
jgi:hypothetical protein